MNSLIADAVGVGVVSGSLVLSRKLLWVTYLLRDVTWWGESGRGEEFRQSWR